MFFELHMPYDASSEYESEEIKGYYKTEQDYVDALDGEFQSTNNEVFQYAAYMNSKKGYENGNLMSVVGYRSGLSKKFDAAGFARRREKPAIVGYSKINVRLEEPHTNIPHNVDSFVEKFAMQKPCLIEFVILSASMDGKFEEELRLWWIDTRAVLEEGKRRGGRWIDEVIPKKTMKVSFFNKSNKKVTFMLNDVEIEERISEKDYVLFVKSMNLIQ